jgi:hypothetical protein
LFFTRKRQLPRLPLSVDVRVESHELTLTARSVEVGGGGMSLRNAETLSVSLPVQVSFELPGAEVVVIQAVVWWKKAELIGIRFDPTDDNRQRVLRWVEEHKQPA